MYSEIDDYRNDGYNHYKKDEFPCQSIQICTFPFEYIKHDEISHSNHYGNDDYRSSEESHIHKKTQRIKLSETFRESQVTISEISDIFYSITNGG